MDVLMYQADSHISANHYQAQQRTEPTDDELPAACPMIL
mgnify:CR=1 FL=1